MDRLWLGSSVPGKLEARHGAFADPISTFDAAVEAMAHVPGAIMMDLGGRISLFLPGRGLVIGQGTAWAPTEPLVIVGIGALLALLIGALVVIRTLRARLRRLREELKDQSLERGRAEDALQTSDAFYHSLVESLPQNIFRKDEQGRFTFANQRFCATLGRSLSEVLGRSDHDFFPESLAEKYRSDDRRVMRTDEVLEDVEEHVLPHGEVRYVQVTKTPLRDAHGNVFGLQGIFWDVTEQRRALEALAASEERFTLAVRGSNDGIWDWDLRSDDIYYSPRFKQLLGYDEEDPAFPNRVESFLSRLHPDDEARVREAVKVHLRDREAFNLEFRMKTRSGAYRWYLARGQAVWDESGRATRMAGSVSDVNDRRIAEEKLKEQNQLLQKLAQSERKALEEREQAQSRMVESAKLAGLGQLVAGVAHEINNPLAYVANNVAVLQRDTEDLLKLMSQYREAESFIERCSPESARQIRQLAEDLDVDYAIDNMKGLIERTRDGLGRIRDIVRDLRAFARLDEGDLSQVDLNESVNSTLTIILGYAKKQRVEVEVEPGELPPVSCNAAKINQVLTNLIVNAIDACEPGGRVTIRSRATSDGSVRIDVIDNGSGIPEEIRDRIFDPFFTTKPVGIGTGLGLSISYSIIQDHGGSIDVTSDIGQGTTFTVSLPTRQPSAPSGGRLSIQSPERL